MKKGWADIWHVSILPSDLQVIPGSLIPSWVEAITSPPVTHLRHCPLPPGQPVTGSLWVPQSAAEPPLGGGAVADMKEEKAAMDCRLAEGLDRQVLGLTRGVGPRPALPLPRLLSCLKDSDDC